MMNIDLNRIGVVGAGTMGSGIAQVFARKGFSVILCDSLPSQLEKALQSIDRNLGREVEKNRLDTSSREIDSAENSIADGSGFSPGS